MKSFLIVLTSILLLCTPIPVLAEEPESNQEALVDCLITGASSWSECYAKHDTNGLLSIVAQSSENDNLQELLANEMQKRPLLFTLLPWTPTPAEIVRDYVIN